MMRASICTSVFNQRDYLKLCIESVMVQTLTDLEHIIVDDGSTEDIKGLVESFNDSRLVYVRFPENRGFQAGYNHALGLATGDYVQLLAADEFIWDKKLEIQVSWMDDHPGIGCTWGLPTPNVGQSWPLGEGKSWEQFSQRAHNRSREAWIRTLLRMEAIPIGGASMLMRKECYDAIGGFDPQFFDVSDLEWFVRFFQKYQGWVLPYRLADAKHPEERLSAPNPGQAKRFQEDVIKLHAKHSIVLPPDVGRVTVGIPVYNMAKFLPEAIASLRKQTFQDFDIMILDDASTDDTAKVMQELADERTQIFRFEENKGVREAVNQMLARCDTQFYVSFAADDFLEPTYLERCLAEFKSDPFLEFVASQTDFIHEDGKTIAPLTHEVQRIPRAANKTREKWLEDLYYGNNYFGVGMIRTAVFKDLGGLDVDAGVLCDYDLYLRLLQRENVKIIEENLTHTRIHDGNASVGPGKIDRFWLRNKYHELKSRYYSPRMKVIIATPFYEMRGFSPYICSLMSTIQTLSRLGIENEFWEVSGDSYVDRAKNTICMKFLEDPSATHLFMIDSDMSWDVQGFLNMLMLPEEIVQGSYPQKNSWEVWTARPELTEETEKPGVFHPSGRMLPDGSALIRAAFLAGGFLRMKRSALEKYREHYKDNVYHDQGADPSFPERTYTAFFECERKPINGVSMRWGEDRVFGLRMKDIGIESWIYPKVDFGHYGVKGWTGNYDTYLKKGVALQ
jgi:glycosyltransferase involved in cell wall biosynthesis